MLKRYHYRIDGKSFGPYSKAQMIEAIRSDALTGKAEISHHWRVPEWKEAPGFLEFQSELQAAADARVERARLERERQLAARREAKALAIEAAEKRRRAEINQNWRPFYIALAFGFAAVTVATGGIVLLSAKHGPTPTLEPERIAAQIQPNRQPTPVRSVVRAATQTIAKIDLDDVPIMPEFFDDRPLKKSNPLAMPRRALPVVEAPIKTPPARDEPPAVAPVVSSKGSTSKSRYSSRRTDPAPSVAPDSAPQTTGETTASGQPIYTGPRGGRYHISEGGNKVYERKKK